MPERNSELDYNEEIVITGMSGQFPSSKNVKEFENNLYNKINMVDDLETRWKHKYPGVPKFQGKIPELSKFDATFFGVHQAQVEKMDPQMRILMEESYKAVMDAGVNPSSLRNSNTGVFIAVCCSEPEPHLMYCEHSPDGLGLLGASKSLLANRISFVMGLNGPSMSVDTACSSSMYALNIAYEQMKNGEIDAAIVGGTNILICPYVTAKFAKLGILSLSGTNRPFDEDANGYVRSEAVSCIFLQRRKSAKRIYATLIKSAVNCDGFKPEGLTYPSGNMQRKLIENFYDQMNFDLNLLGYVEAHSTGTVAGDPEECKALDEAICKKRRETLLIGSVKSNCGHAEASSGVVSIVKVLLTLNNNCIPPNINFSKPRQTIDALMKGKLKVVTEKTVLKNPFICINSFGFGGANAHALLKQNTTEYPVPSYGSENDLPYLFTWLGRTEAATQAVIDCVESRPLNLEHLALMRSSQIGGIKGFVYRGYNVLRPSSGARVSKPVSLVKDIQYNEGVRAPIIWIFSGMGSQWVGMGKELLKIKACKDSLLKSHELLKPKGVDLINILTSDNPKMLENILNSFVGITAIQIALIDLLQMLDMQPDFLIGHSLGEIGCAYADGCATAEETILASYYRGKVCTEVKTIRGAMAAVGLGFKDIKDSLPLSIEAACHNSSDSTTISGPLEDVTKFVESLKAKNIFAKEVPCSNIAFHSRYIQHYQHDLLKCYKKLIRNPKPRSNRWISTSVPSENWNQPESKFFSAEYNVTNLLSSVLFEEAVAYLPKKSIAIEIAPHALLQSILKSCMPDSVHVGLARRSAKDNVLHLLQSLGELYANGCELSLEKLYPPIQWPVSRGTPTISDLLEFDHTQDYLVYKFEDSAISTGNKLITISPMHEHKFLLGHEIDGRPLVPATFYLESVWKVFALTQGSYDFESIDVEFENVRFIRATTLSAKDEISLQVSIQQGTGLFEISESKTLVASGIIRKLSEKARPSSVTSTITKDEVQLSKTDFYKELKLRGYHYKNDFQSVLVANADGSYGKIKWFNNWTTFMDCMLQLCIVRADSRNLMLPVKLRSMRIMSSYHKKLYPTNCDIEVYGRENGIFAGGIEIIDLKTSHIQRRKPPGQPVLEKYLFIPNFNAPKLAVNDISRCCIQLFAENFSVASCSVVQVATSARDDLAFLKGLVQAINNLPVIQGNYLLFDMSENKNFDKSVITKETGVKYVESIDEIKGGIDVLLLSEGNFSSVLLTLDQRLAAQSMVLMKTKDQCILEKTNLTNKFVPVALFPCSNSPYSILTLFKKSADEPAAQLHKEIFIKISQYDDEFQWMDVLKTSIGKRLILVGENEPHSGLIGLVNCLRKEPETANVRCIFIDDMSAPKFDPNLPFYGKQLQLGLAINIYRQGQWGSYRHLELKAISPEIEHTNHICGAIGNVGDFSTLHWKNGQMSKDDGKTRIVYSALNFRDVMHASGRLSAEDIGLKRLEQSNIFGLEYSGINERTEKAVMGMALHSAIASHIESNPIISWEVPSAWTLQEAATVPVVYTTVYYAFFYTADIRSGKDILIHSGSGGVGIAAIRTALAYGLEVYTTVSTDEKKRFLLNTFPQLKEANIGNSRDCSFEEMIRNRTNGRGVDFILNSLSEEKLTASLRCLAPNGSFLEIGKFDMANDSSIGLGVFFQGQKFFAVLADKLEQYAPYLLNKIKLHIAEDIEKGIVRPLPSTVFKPNQLEHAFRYLMMAKHIGKVLIEIRPNAGSLATHPVAATPKAYFNKELVYIVPGGLGGFGLELVDWMVLRGARKIVLSSRRGLTDQYQKSRIAIWNSYKCEIRVNTADITTENGCAQLLKDSMKLGSIGGIFNLAVLLKDGIFANQTPESFQQSFGPKAFATKYLDKLSQQLCPQLHYFVIYSSVSCGRGNAGQTNYGMANSIMERIIEERIKLGYPGKAIQWGAVGEVGLVADMAEGKIDINIGGTLQQRISSCLEVLDTLLTASDPIVGSMVVAEKKGLAESETALEYVMNTLSLTRLKSVAANAALSELGMDSLMGVEIKQTLERNFDIMLTPAEVRALTIDRLRELSESHKKKSVDKPLEENVSNSVVDIFEGLLSNLSYKSGKRGFIVPLNNIDSDQVPIIIFPGAECVSSESWENIGTQLKAPAYCVQLLVLSGAGSYSHIIEIAVKEIEKVLKSHRAKSFRIMAYSFGTLAAHIACKRLESLGFSGSLIYVDASPIWLENFTKQVTPNDILEIKRRVLLMALKPVVNEEQMNTFRKAVKDIQNIELIYWHIKQNVILKDADEWLRYLKEVMDNTDTIFDLSPFKLVEILESKILIIRPAKLLQPDLDEFYGLKPLIRNTVDVKCLQGDHFSVLANKELPPVVNEYFKAN